MAVASIGMVMFKADYRRKAAELKHSLTHAAASEESAAPSTSTQHLEMSGHRDDAAETTKLLLSS